MTLMVNKAFIDSYWHQQNEIAIEKAKKGEQASFHKYIYRKETGKKDRPYIYVWLEDLLKNPVKTLFGVFGIDTDTVDKQYKSARIKDDFEADKKIYAQHLLEYFCHRSVWDKRFSDKDKAKQMDKKVKMSVAAKADVQGMETPKAEDNQMSLFADDGEQKWKANPYLMRRIWAMYSGKNVVNQEKQQAAAKNVVETENTINSSSYEQAKTVFESAYDEAKYNLHNNGILMNDGALITWHSIARDLREAQMSYNFFTGPHNTDWSKYDINETLKDYDGHTEISDFDRQTLINYAKEKVIQDELRNFINGEKINIEQKNNGLEKPNRFNGEAENNQSPTSADNNNTAAENVNTDTTKLSQAMMGNQNAKKLISLIEKYEKQLTDDEKSFVKEREQGCLPHKSIVRNDITGQEFAGIYKIHPNRKLTNEENYMATLLSSFGFDVYMIDEPTTGGKKVDAIVNGIPVDFKNVGLGNNAVKNNYQEGMDKENAKGIIMRISDDIKYLVKDKNGNKVEKPLEEAVKNWTKTKNNGILAIWIDNLSEFKVFDMKKIRADNESRLEADQPNKNSNQSINNNNTNAENVNTDTSKLSQAMMGNQNARKYGLTDEEYKEISSRIYDFARTQILYPTDSKDLDLLIGILNNSRSEGDRILSKDLKEIAKKSGKYLSELLIDGYNDYIGEKNNGTDNTSIGSGRISGIDGTVQPGNTQDNGSFNGSETADGSNGNQLNVGTDESGIGLGSSTNGSGFLGSGRLSKKDAKEIRAKCREILQKPDSEITAADKEILANYEGAGGLHEGNQTDAAVLSEFYTPRDVISKVWQLVDKYNPNQNKKVIEPSAGTGRFAEGRTEKFTLCELDPTSARIAGLLHPNADVKQGEFQKLFVKNNSVQKEYKGDKYDVAVGNPPYGDYTGFYKGIGEGKIHTRYEEYFIDRTLDTLKEGGIMAFVVPSGFLRNQDSKAKQVIAAKGKLLEAWRLPKGTFSSTDVGTDIIVLRKEPGNLEDFNNNKYFTDNPSHVIGYESFDGNWGSAVINRPEGKSIEDCINMIDVKATEVDKRITEIVDTVKAELKPPVEKDYSAIKFEVGADIFDKNGNKGKITYINNAGMIGYKMDNGSMGRVAPEKFEVNETASEEHQNRSEAMKGNQNAKKAVHKERIAKAKKGDLYTPSNGKNMSSEEFNKKYSKNIPQEDMKFWKLTDWEGKIDTTKLSDSEIKELENNKNFVKVDGKYMNVVNYASGDIYGKLVNLESKKDFISDEEYQLRKSLLEAVLPAPKTVYNFTVSPLANFAKTYRNQDGLNLIEQFEAWAGFKDGGYIPYGFHCPISKNELEDGMVLRDIWDYIHGVPVRAERSRDPDDKDTSKMFAEQKKRDRKEVTERIFNEWLRQLPSDQIKDIEKEWNSIFNTFVNPDYTKIPLFVDGMNENKGTKKFDLTTQQIKGVSQLCNKGNGILAYDVGVGKTVTGIVATVNQIQTGKAKRPLICVPKAVYKKWIKEVHQHFPDLQVNELSNFNEKDLGKFKDSEGHINLPENALNICSYEALQKITFKEETINGELMDDMLDSQSVYDYDENGNLIPDTRTDKEKAEAKEKILKQLGQSAKAKEGAVYWEDLGIDHITVDELHNFKNIFSIPRNIGKSSRRTNELHKDRWGRVENPEDAAPTMSNEYSGVAGSSSSRGMKMFAITQLVQRQTNGKGFFGLSATPFNNSPVEIYNILSLCARNRLKELGVYNLGDFMKEFAEMKPDWKVKANGDVESAQVMKNFKNLGALQNLITEFIDKVDGEEAGVVRPRKQVHKPELDLTPLQKQMLEVETMRMNGYFSKVEGKPTGDTLVAMNNMRMITLSPKLIDPKFYKDYEEVIEGFEPPKGNIVEESPKLTFVCDLAAKQYKDRPTEGQVIYMPRGVEQYEEVKQYLVKQGMPADSIAFMDSSTSADKKEQIMNDFNSSDGKIKIIIGSETIKEGVSLNGNSTTIYNTMLGWNPTETIQVEGRIWRQGNKQGITHIVYPLMNDSIDSMMYQKYDEKSSRLNALWSYKGDSLNVEDIDPEELKFQLIKDPKKRAKMQIQQEQADLKKQKKMLNASYDNLYEQIRERNYQQNLLVTREVEAEKSQKIVDEQSTVVEAKKKALDSAKKAKNKELIDIAQDSYDSAKADLDLAKSRNRMNANSVKEAKNKIASIENYWSKQGFEPDEADARLEKISQNRQEVEGKIGDIQSRESEYVEKAKQAIAAEQAAQRHYSVQDRVNYYAKEIGDNLKPMDDQLRAEIKAELEERFPHLKKSIFVVKGGKFLIRK